MGTWNESFPGASAGTQNIGATGAFQPTDNTWTQLPAEVTSPDPGDTEVAASGSPGGGVTRLTPITHPRLAA